MLEAMRRTPGAAGGWLGAVLSQDSRAEPLARLDSLADSLIVAVVRKDQVGGAEAQAVALAALTALIASADGRAKIPYRGAFERLAHVHRDVVDAGLRAVALSGMARLADDRARGLDYLQQVATSDDRTAYRAVEILAHEMGDDGRARLRDVFMRGTVTNEHARQILEPIARHYGWVRTGRVRSFAERLRAPPF
jgi:hypothetical protein